MPGRYYDQWQVGDRLTHQPSRTVTETDNVLFSAMTYNCAPLHIDAEYSKDSIFGQRLVNSMFLLALVAVAIMAVIAGMCAPLRRPKRRA